MKIYQFDNISVEISGSIQSLVQSVTVSSDRGLDFVTLNNQTFQDVVKKGQIITIQINYLSGGSFYNPTTAPLNDGFGDIKIYRLDGANTSQTQTITFHSGILVGTSSSIDANSSYYGSSSATYQATHYTNSTEAYSADQRPSPTFGNIKSRECYSGLQTNQLTYSSTCTISRKYLFEPGRVKPTHLAIEYPIITTSTVGMIAYSGWTPTGAGAIPNCSGAATESVDAGIPTPYLEGVDIEGAPAGGNDYQIANYNYKSTNSYGLTRIHSIS